MANGTVKFFNAAKGFGFITPEDGSKDVFVPAVSVTASGIPTLKPGQSVSFETEPDGKGPKAVNLKVLADAPKPPPQPAPRPVQAPAMERFVAAPQMAPPRLTVFHDPSSDASHLVLDVLDELEQEPRLVDYIATPPDREALKSLSLLMRGGDQSLVRKYDPLFLELRLDDRFISDAEFWSAIVEHPSLINGPVLATPQKARVCRTEQAVKAFLGIDNCRRAPASETERHSGAYGACGIAVRARRENGRGRESRSKMLEKPRTQSARAQKGGRLEHGKTQCQDESRNQARPESAQGPSQNRKAPKLPSSREDGEAGEKSRGQACQESQARAQAVGDPICSTN